jgi:hypothetical protein
MPDKIILVVDEDGGYIKAEFVTSAENADEENILIYKQVEYYHDLKSALRDC